MISENQKLFFFDEDNGPVYVETDASDYAVGGVCYQSVKMKDPLDPSLVRTVRKALKFFSKLLSAVQRRWPANEKEQYALVVGLKTFEYLVRDIHFILRTDHRNLQFLKVESAKVLRWKIFIQEFNFELEYYPGANNVAADALSRLPQRDWESFPPSVNLNIDDSRFEQSIVAKPIDLRSTVIPVESREDLMVVDDLVLDLEKFSILETCHNDLIGHHGVERTLERLKRNPAYLASPWIYARQYVNTFVRQCPTCQKMSYIKPVIHALPFTTSSYAAMLRISIDTVGPLPKSEEGYTYILVIIDSFTRFCELYPLTSTGADEAAVCLMNFLGRYGEPDQIISDRGTQFLNQVFHHMAIAMDYHLEHMLTGSKEENAIVERSIREVLRHLIAIVNHRKVNKIWAQVLPMVQRIMNATVHSALGVSPAQILFGNAVRLERGMFKSNPFLENGARQSPFHKTKNSVRLWIDRMLSNQQACIDAALETISARDAQQISSHSLSELTVLTVNSYVLVAYLPLEVCHWKEGP
jgi:hypothetical protein